MRVRAVDGSDDGIGKFIAYAFLYASLLVLAGCLHMGESKEDQKILRADPENGRYFTDNSGKAIYLTGSHTWYTVHGRPTAPTEAQFEQYLDWMQAHGYNFTRLWTGWMNNRLKVHARSWVCCAYDGGQRFDLNTFEQTYFDAVKSRVAALKKRNMYCSVMFFGSLIGIRDANWSRFDYHPANNINPVSFSGSNGLTFFNPNAADLALQQAQVRKFIDELHTFDNVIFEIGNEAGKASHAWQNQMVDYAHAYELATYGTRHPVGITGGYDFGAAMFDSHADWVSPDFGKPWGNDYWKEPPAEYQGKVIVLDTDHLYNWGFIPDSEAPNVERWVWKAFTRGTNPIFMEQFQKMPTLQTPPDAFSGIRARLRQTREFADRLADLAQMRPSTSIASTRYALAAQGREYLVYQPAKASFTVHLAAGNYTYEWFDPVADAFVATGSFSAAAGNRQFSPPDAISADSVLYLHAEASPKP